MANYKEIVTKAVIGKAKKNNKMHFSFTPDEVVDTILGCWIINHNFSGLNDNGKVALNGSFDINVWYAYNNNTKTKVNTKEFSYHEVLNIPLKSDAKINNNSDILVRSLKQPTVSEVNIKDGNINLEVEKEMGIEVVGDAIIKVPIEEDYDDYDEIIDDNELEIEEELNDNYLDKEESK